MADNSKGLVCFAHGKESGPWGFKIRHLAEIARSEGFAVLSPDFQGIDDPDERISLLTTTIPDRHGPLVLVGSSMGGYVMAHAAASLRATGLLLIAPALYFPDWDRPPTKTSADTHVIHGWGDDIVPVDAGIRYARENNAQLHVVSGDHMLHDSIDYIGAVLLSMLRGLKERLE